MSLPVIGPLSSSTIIQRSSVNPILSPEDVPYESTLAYNGGVVRYQGRYVMLFRNEIGYDPQQKKPTRTDLGLAYSSDGVHWDVQPHKVFDWHDEEVRAIYDTRLTVLDGRVYITFAVDSKHGWCGGLAVTDDFEHFDVLNVSLPDNRDQVLFPEKIGGRYLLMQRPMPFFGRGEIGRFDIWLSASPDLRHWGDQRKLVCVEDVPYANEKLGAGTPPVRTPRGWLSVFHAVDTDFSRGKNGWEDRWQKRYTAGVMLLDLDDPYRVIAVSQKPLLAPETSYETSEGYRYYNVIFPMGLIVEDGGEVKLYYSANDTIECLATTHLDELLAFCLSSE